MTDARHGNTTEPSPEAASGYNRGFLKGVLGGVLIGTVAGVLFAPTMNAALGNLRRRLKDAAAGTYRHATTRVGDAVDDLQQKGRGIYGKALSAVARGADDVKERAADAQAELDQSAAQAARR